MDTTQTIDTLFTTQKQAFAAHCNVPLAERINRLTRLRQVLITYQDAFCEAINQDFTNRSVHETKIGELMTVVDHINQTIKHLPKWMKNESRTINILQQPGSGWIQYQPLGVVAIISPWNYPLVLSVGPLISALAAGNHAILKPSSKIANFTAVLKKALAEAFDDSLVAVIEGPTALAAHMSKLPFDQITFTGSGNVGKSIMADAAQNLTPVLLELGGKSPAIVHESMDMADVAARLTFGKFWNAGQTCVAPDYVFIPNERVDEFVTAMQQRISKCYPTLKDNPDYTALIDMRSKQRLESWLAEAKEQGATIIEVNPANEDLTGTQKLIPTLVTQTTTDMLLRQQEIFGPILPIVPYNHIDEAIDYINAHPKPLALYYFDFDEKRLDYLAQHTSSGHLGANHTLTHVTQDDLPFGGVGASGMGKYHGIEGFKTMSNARSVMKQGRLYTMKMIAPPFVNHFIFKTLFKNRIG